MIGIIFYELICPIPADDWVGHIKSIREGRYLQSESLSEDEKALMEVLIHPDALYRPSNAEDIIDVVDMLRDNITGFKKLIIFGHCLWYFNFMIFTFVFLLLRLSHILGENDNEFEDDFDDEPCKGKVISQKSYQIFF